MNVNPHLGTDEDHETKDGAYTDPRSTMSVEELRQQAVAALTELGRLPIIDDDAVRYPDFADEVARAVTAAAGNVGSLDLALGTNPSSASANLVRALVEQVAPEGEVHRHRTNPVHVYASPVMVFNTSGVFDLYMREVRAAEANGDQELAGAMGEVMADDILEYGAEFTAVVQEHAVRLGVPVPVIVHNLSENGYQGPLTNAQSAPLADLLRRDAEERTVLPMTGRRPDEQKASRDPVVYPSGRTYLARARERLAQGS